jgi:hypothetical protein
MNDVDVDGGNGRTVLWRLRQLERKADALSEKKADADDEQKLAEEVAGLRRALITFSLSLVGSAGAFVIGVLGLTQNGG